MIDLANDLHKTSLLSSKIPRTKYKMIHLFIFVTALVSATTEYYFLYTNSAYPMFKNVIIANIIAIIAVTFIEGIKIYSLKSLIQTMDKRSGIVAPIIIFILLFSPSAGVSWFISMSGANSIIKETQIMPVEMSRLYIDSVDTYYSTLITNIRTNPSSSATKKVESIDADIKDLKKELKSLSTDKQYKIGNEIMWEIRPILQKKEALLNKLISTKTDIVSSDQSGIDSKKEIARLEQEHRAKKSMIEKKKEEFSSEQDSEKSNALYYIIFNELFAIVLNAILTIVNQYRSETQEEKRARIETAVDKVFYAFYRGNFKNTMSALVAYTVASTDGEQSGRCNQAKFERLYFEWCEVNGKNPAKKAKKARRTNDAQPNTEMHKNAQNNYDFVNN